MTNTTPLTSPFDGILGDVPMDVLLVQRDSYARCTARALLRGDGEVAAIHALDFRAHEDEINRRRG